MKNLAAQVAKAHYFGLNYITPSRLAAYAYQFQEIMAIRPKNVLEIGIGNGLLTFILRKAGVKVATLDFDQTLRSDVVASVTDIAFQEESFDVVVCFEVLEHIPFAHFLPALQEIYRVTRSHLIISLPDCRHCLRLYLPKIGRRQFLLDKPLFHPQEHKFDGEHYWEINKSGYPLRKIAALIEKSGFSIEKTYRIWELPLNRLFRLRKVKSK